MTKLSARSGITVVDLDQDHLLAVQAVKSGRGVAVERCAAARRPETIDALDPVAVGQWIGTILKDEGLNRQRVVLALPRANVVLKTLAADEIGSGTLTEAELISLVHLRLQRQAAIAGEKPVVDFVPLPIEGDEQKDGAPKSAVAGGVLAGAVPSDRLEWGRRAVRAAGGKLRGIELRSMGIATLMAPASLRAAGPVLGVSNGPASTEFVVVDRGLLVFARSVTIRRPEPAEDGTFAEGAVSRFAQRVAVEARRTWMSYRVTPHAGEMDAAVVLNTDDIARAVVTACETELGLPIEAVGLPDIVTKTDRIDSATLPGIMPLLGLLVQRATKLPRLDFENPREPPDTGAKWRQGALAASFLLLVAGGAGYVWIDGQISDLEAERDAAQAQLQSLTSRYTRAVQLGTRLDHLEAWDAADVDLSAYLRFLSDELPAPPSALVSELALDAQTELSWEPENRSFPGTYSSSLGAVLDVSGPVVGGRDVMLSMRERLLGRDWLAVASPSRDEPDAFSLELLARGRQPQQSGDSQENAAPTDGEPQAGGEG